MSGAVAALLPLAGLLLSAVSSFEDDTFDGELVLEDTGATVSVVFVGTGTGVFFGAAVVEAVELPWPLVALTGGASEVAGGPLGLPLDEAGACWLVLSLEGAGAFATSFAPFVLALPPRGVA